MYFVGYAVLDRGAIDQLQIACASCEAEVDSGGKPGDRYLACHACYRALELPRGWAGLDGLAPRRDEPFDSWYARAGSHLSNVPDEVAREWIHRHWGQSSYEWMPLLGLHFSLEEWPLDRLLRVAVGSRGRQDAYEVRENPGQWVQDYMDKHGTWSTPIIVLEGGPTLRDDMHDLRCSKVIGGWGTSASWRRTTPAALSMRSGSRVLIDGQRFVRADRQSTKLLGRGKVLESGIHGISSVVRVSGIRRALRVRREGPADHRFLRE